MGIYKKILVAIDLSEESWHTLSEAVKIIRNKDTWAVITTVAPQYTGDLGLVLGDFQKTMFKPYEDLISRAKNYLAEERILAKFVLEEGEPFERIVDLAYAENCDLIVMGKTGSGMQRLLLGSTAARVIGYSPVDVLIVPFKSRVAWNKILVPLDLSSFSEKAYNKALKLAKDYQSELFLFSVIDLPVEALAESPQLYERIGEKVGKVLKEYAEKAMEEGVKTQVDITEGDPVEKILSFAEEKGISLLVMGSYGKTGLKRLLMGSVTEKVISLGDRPVLVVKN
ncbi:hypothetical protein THC_0877 [Caldimicrobium thiodismutans]|jgi:nucleotide-binding universal stress UspA family protein|uniref:UspA domain-containing protein n=1 Tax=Caldimicrobium thiodismutans TaxID=1653476 RepID=A0A0U5AXA5_9BACT|nr:universal stress protein [Caldimicrobium thiodismutans]BAU23262.1 hypothetical protein THC_0877 [Caldimicrobium thiodismutans]